MCFVFFHISSDLTTGNEMPSMLVRSIRKHYLDVEIIQVSDSITPMVDGVSSVFRCDGNLDEIMAYRINAFSKLGLEKKAIYLDTDMLILKKFNISNIFNNQEVVLLKRDFMNDAYINTNFRNMDLSYLEGKTIGEVWPYIGCLRGSTSNKFWTDSSNYINKLDKQSRYWYGDQDTIKEIVKNNSFTINEINEKKFACPPKFFEKTNPPYILHFKGYENKDLMKSVANQIGI
jgi:hypothetical protein